MRFQGNVVGGSTDQEDLNKQRKKRFLTVCITDVNISLLWTQKSDILWRV